MIERINKLIGLIADILNASPEDIHDIEVLKKGMTNRSFMFSCGKERYIMRIPGEGTQKLINRHEEAAVYDVIKDKNICDDIIYLDPDNGHKITRFWDNARVCNADDPEDLKKCMDKLKSLHKMSLIVPHTFDIFGKIDFYEDLWNGAPSEYEDYETVKDHVLSLRTFIDKNVKEHCLTHIDAVPDNFMILPDGKIRLIDWEYAAMQDPHVDIAMFCIYSMYERSQVDRLIDIYFENTCPASIRMKIYCYIAACGLLWSNWCEYKKSLGVEFGEYSRRQYQYAKEYYDIFCDESGEDVT